ncbi:zona pellucida sperm-binding protein 3 receptor-like [Dreissena polymorpha]|uniref:zona pellucida sperm-binding protein 3 receptor-like n=1 Tax=Dreissena polymorpha TaxID=45954 RepID=UPI002264B83E|nr:zona pellucida sperm-binding protein 3 receptor-like [Dreissena polymorpha]
MNIFVLGALCVLSVIAMVSSTALYGGYPAYGGTVGYGNYGYGSVGGSMGGGVCKASFPNIPNARKVNFPPTVGTVVPYSCDSGFSPDPTSRMIATCDANGIWQPSVACLKQCQAALPTIPNARTSEVTGALTVGTVVPYSCDSGYSPDPTSRMIATCDANGIWQPSVACLKLCQASLPTILNAKPSAVPGPLTVGTVVPYSCDSGYSPDPTSRMIATCDANGIWQPSVACLKRKNYCLSF